MTRDENDIGFCLSDTCSNRADSDLGDELNVDAGFGVGILEVVNELCHVLNGVDVMVRRGRDKTYAWGSTTHFGNSGKHLVTG